MIPALSLYQHRKTGGYYIVLTRDAVIEATMTRAVVYQSIPGGHTWVRPYDEFFDGRFGLVGLMK